jgi:hypothetical protein
MLTAVISAREQRIRTVHICDGLKRMLAELVGALI